MYLLYILYECSLCVTCLVLIYRNLYANLHKDWSNYRDVASNDLNVDIVVFYDLLYFIVWSFYLSCIKTFQ